MTKCQNQASAMTDEQLPPLPNCALQFCTVYGSKPSNYFTERQMRDYARSALATPAQQTEAPKDAELAALLPGTYYMDMPDGGSVTILEQLQRMAKDAERYRWIVSNEKEASNVVEQYGICYLAGYIDADLERAATAKEKRNE